MNNFIFENKTKVYFGKRCVGEYLPKIAAMHGDKVLFAYGGGSIKKNGVYEEVIAALEKAGKTIIEFPGIMENPTYKKVLEGTKLVKEKQVTGSLQSAEARLWTAARQFPWQRSARKMCGMSTGRRRGLWILNRCRLV